MADYEGMRWFKCDFQVQTPENATHWGDADTRLPEPRRLMALPAPDADGVVGPAKADENRLQEIARIYLRLESRRSRCGIRGYPSSPYELNG